MRNLDAIIRVRMLLYETSMLLFVFRIMFVLIRVFRELDRYGLARVINSLCLFFQLKENLLYSQWQRRLFSNTKNNLPRQTWILMARNQFLIVLKLCITQS